MNRSTKHEISGGGQTVIKQIRHRGVLPVHTLKLSRQVCAHHLQWIGIRMECVIQGLANAVHQLDPWVVKQERHTHFISRGETALLIKYRDNHDLHLYLKCICDMIQLRTADEFPGFFYQPFRQILLSTPLKKFNEDEKPTNVAFVLVKEFRVHSTMALSPC